MKRLLYVIPRYARDLMGNRIHTEIIHCWQRAGITVDLLSFDAGLRVPEYEELDEIPVYRLPISATPLAKGLNRLADPLLHYPYLPGMARVYHGFLAQHQYDFVHVETAFPLGVVASWVPRHPPMAVTLPGADVMAERAFDYGYARFGAVRLMLRGLWARAALLRADSRKIQRQTVALGCAPHKAVAIPYNITDGEFPPTDVPIDQLKAAARTRIGALHGLAPTTRLVLSLSRLHPFKGVEFLVRAAPLVLQYAPDTVFLIAGPNRTTAHGDYGAFLEQLARELGVAAQVRLIGLVPHGEVRDYYAAADAVVVPSVSEALNRVAIEAAAVSTPAVVTRTTGISEYMAEDGYGLIVEPQSGLSIAAALRVLLTNPQRQRALAANGPRMAARFRSSLIASELLEHYQRVLRPT